MRRLRTLLAVGTTAAVAGAAALVPGIARADSTIYVGTAPTCPDAQFSSLTNAVRYAQPHDTIRICPGTYTVGPTPGTAVTAAGLQGLVIDKTLQIIGAGASRVTIEPTQDLVQAASAADNIRDALGNVITVTNTTPGDTSDFDVNPVISGVTISDGGHLVDAGIAFNNAAGTITDSTVGPFTGSQPTTAQPNVGWGVVASNNYAVTPQGSFIRDVTVSNNLITGYGGGGVLLDGSESTKPIYFRSGVSTTGAISGNFITGAASTAEVQQYGIQVNAGARAAITGNAITGNLSATPGSATHPGSGVGILLTDADVTTNTVGSTTAYYTRISGNNLTGNGYGIFNGTADFPGANAGDANQGYPIEVNGTGTTPTDLPTLTNTAMGGTVNYDTVGVTAKGVASNYYGTAGPVIGGPSTTTADGISESTSGGADSVPSTNSHTASTITPAPAPAADAAPSASWGTPDGTVDTTLTAGTADELLVAASDDFGVSSVDINADGVDLGTMTLPPYETTWTPPVSLVGQTIPLTATVTDENGQVTISTIHVTVVAPSAAPATIPSTPMGSTTNTTPVVAVGTPVPSGPTLAPRTGSPQVRTATVTAGNARVVVTIPLIKSCLAPTAKLKVTYRDAVIAGSKGTRLTFLHATLTLDGKLRATAKKKTQTFELSLRGLKKFTYTLTVASSYRYKVGKTTKSLQKIQKIKVKVC